MYNNITNASGKFVSPTSHAASEASVVDVEVQGKLVIPPTPVLPVVEKAASSNYMGYVREYFGKLWWLWLVVIVFWLAKGE